jgi:long-chain acyl-CoA synthetase
MQDLTWPLRHAMTYYPEREAVVDGDLRLSFHDLGARVQRLSAGLRAKGVRPGTRVATLLSNSHRYLELHYAIPGAGAIVVPLNSRLAVPEMEYILKDAGVTHLIVDEAHDDVASHLTPLVEQVLRIPDEYENLIAAHEPEDLPGPDSEDAPAGIYYTGGTSGPAKGVVLSHRALIGQSMSLGIELDLQRQQRILIVFPLFHLGSICGMYVTVWLGSTLVFQPAVVPTEILQIIARERITMTSLVPTVINALVSHPEARRTDFSSLRLVVHGAAPISPTLCAQAVEVFGCGVTQAYGMTEMAGGATLLKNEQDLLDTPQIRSAGLPMVGYEIQVRREDGSRCEIDEVGEVVLRGPSMLTEYWNKPEETFRVLRDGWYWSGDMGFQDCAGYVYLVDRSKDMIVTGGENVYSIEVENAIAAHPDVLEVAVFGVPDDSWGERVHAVVVPKDGCAPAASEIITFCRERIAGYKTPKSVELRNEELPKSGVGKVLKRELREAHWQGHGRYIG